MARRSRSRALRRSLSGRLLLLFLTTALLLALVVRTGLRYGIESGFRDSARLHLDQYLSHLLTEIGDPPDRERAARLAERLRLRIHLLGAENWSAAGPPPTFVPRSLATHTLDDGTLVELGTGTGGLLVRLRRGGHTLLLETNRAPAHSYASLAILATTITGVLLVLALSYHATRRLFRPIETIQAGIARIGAGDLRHRLEIRRRDELGELARGINAMADQIEEMLEAKRQLLLAISHELRSPLTRARINAELLDENANREALLGNLAELAALLDELLESERLRGQHGVLKREATDPTALVTGLVEECFPTAGIRLDLDPPGTWLPLDAARIRVMVRNLLKNALRHTPETGPPACLSSHLEQEGWVLEVADAGPGIPPEHLARLAEPFYRVDSPRGREDGGVGLGLYLCRVIARAHGGDLQIASAPGRGTRVLVCLPIGQGD